MHLREQRWCSSESTRLPPMWPRFNSKTLASHVVLLHINTNEIPSEHDIFTCEKITVAMVA